MRKFFLATLFVLGQPAHAGPDTTTNYFINNSPSILDFGIYRLEQFLESDDRTSWVAYDWDNDQIIIGLRNTIFSEPFTVDKCNHLITSQRNLAGYNNGVLSSVFTHSYFARFFSHAGYISGTQEDNTERLKELDKKFQLICWAGETKVSGPVVGTAISVTVEE